MTNDSKEKVWKDYGFFQTYDAAKTELEKIKDDFDKCKIRLIKEKSKEGWFKIKTWSKSPSVSKKKPKTKKKKNN